MNYCLNLSLSSGLYCTKWPHELHELNSSSIDYIPILTGSKRSLGQGNVFTGVCLSTGVLASQYASQVIWQPGGSASRGSTSTGDCLQGDRGLYPGGVGQTPPQFCLQGVGQTPQDTRDTMGYGQQVGILVYDFISHNSSRNSPSLYLVDLNKKAFQ